MVTVINPPQPATPEDRTKGNGNGQPRKTILRGGGGGGGGSRGGGGGSGGDNKNKGGDGEEGGSPRPNERERLRMVTRYRIFMAVLLVIVLMTFASLTIAYILSSGMRGWHPIDLPPLLWVSTALILASSLTFEFARRAWKRGSERSAFRLLLTTAALGIGFLISQLICWQHLVQQGIYLANNPYSSFFYILTGVHAVHIIGGIGALGFLLRLIGRHVAGDKTREAANASVNSAALSSVRRQAALDAGAIYWHVVDGLWFYVFVLLFVWR